MFRRIRRAAALAAAFTTIATGTVAVSTMSASPAAATLPDVTITMIDTGVRVTHQEFDYVSQTDTTDQVVAWWDFSGEATPANHLPGAGDLWDTTTNGGEPFDNNGHGTNTASLAVGLNAAGSSTKRPSLCPGCKLAIAKVGEGDGSISGSIAEAIKWARETVQTDVISMSIGNVIPVHPQYDTSIYREIRLAREAGILFVAANGNGYLGAALLPGQLGFSTCCGNSPYALGVGGGDRTTIFSNQTYSLTTDPEVVSDYSFVRVALVWCDTCYGQLSGTSLAAPIVAGLAARLMQQNPAMTADYFEKLIKYSAFDSLTTPVFEGYGVVDGAGTQLSTALAHAAAGTLPARPSPDINGLYVETVQGALDDVWTDKANEGSQVIVNPGIGTTSPPGTIGHSAPTGLSDAEVYKLTANKGDVVTVDLGYAAPDAVSDLDLYVLGEPAAGLTAVQSGSEMVAYSINGAGVDEAVSFVAPSTGDYYVVSLGHLVVQPQAFTITSNKTLNLAYEGYVLHTFGTGLPYELDGLWIGDLLP